MIGDPSNLRTTLTTMIVAYQRLTEAFEYRISETIEQLFTLAGWTDERKADLYASLVESIKPNDKFVTVEEKVSRALNLNAMRFNG